MQEPMPTNTRLIIVMGVSGSGKSTIAGQLADALGATYLDADAYHPASNIAKMSRGEALQDQDRWPWLTHFAESMTEQQGVVVGACSALRKAYRHQLTASAAEPLLFIYLNGTKALIRQRMMARKGHFMPDSLLDSQFATLEVPTPDERMLNVDISGSTEAIIAEIVAHIAHV